MEIEFDGTYDKKMFIQGLNLLENRTPIKRILRWLSLFTLVFVFGVAINDWIKNGSSLNELHSLGRPLLVAVLLVFYYVSPYIDRWYKTRRLFDNIQTRRMLGKADLQGIAIGPLAGNTTRFKWERFMRRARHGDTLVLLSLDGSMALFHQCFFRDERDWSHFLQLVEQRVIQPK